MDALHILSHASSIFLNMGSKKINLLKIRVREQSVMGTEKIDRIFQKKFEDSIYFVFFNAILLFFSLGGGSGQCPSDRHTSVWSWQDIMSNETIQTLTPTND